MSQARPRIPQEWRRPSLAGTALIAGHALGLFVVPAVTARYVVGLDLPIWAMVAALVPLVLLAGQGLHMLAFLGHEGFHFSLHRNKEVSATIAVLLSALAPGHLEVGFAISHWNHHRFTNREGDPDGAVFRRFRWFGSRLLSARPAAQRSYAANTLRLALGLPLPFLYKFPLKDPAMKRLARLNIAWSAIVHVTYLAIAIADPLTGLVSIGLPMLAVVLISGLRPYLEHAGTGIGEYVEARTRTSPLFTALYLGTNYHLEHHLYPNIPCYRLPRVHRALRAQGFLGEAHVESGVFSVYRHVTSGSQYPDAAAD